MGAHGSRWKFWPPSGASSGSATGSTSTAVHEGTGIRAAACSNRWILMRLGPEMRGYDQYLFRPSRPYDAATNRARGSAGDHEVLPVIGRPIWRPLNQPRTHSAR